MCSLVLKWKNNFGCCLEFSPAIFSFLSMSLRAVILFDRLFLRKESFDLFYTIVLTWVILLSKGDWFEKYYRVVGMPDRLTIVHLRKIRCWGVPLVQNRLFVYFIYLEFELEAVLSALLIGTFMLLSRFLGEDGIELGFIISISDSFMMVLLMFGGAWFLV